MVLTQAWLFTILHNTFRNLRRHDIRSPIDVDSETVEQAADLVAQAHTPEQLLTRDTLDVDLQAALDSLPEAFRQAVWLRDVEEFSYAEIARIVGIPIGTRDVAHLAWPQLLYDRLAGNRAGARAVGCRVTGPLSAIRGPQSARSQNRSRPSVEGVATSWLLRLRLAASSGSVTDRGHERGNECI